MLIQASDIHYFSTFSNSERFEGSALQALNHVGNYGWEVVAVLLNPDTQDHMYVLKREA